MCEPARSKCTSTFGKSHFSRNLQVKCRANLGPHFVRACAVENSQNACQRKFTGKMLRSRASPERRHTLSASLRSGNACQHFTRATFVRKFTRKMPAQNADTHFVRACAVEMHVSISQQPIYTEMFRKNADAQSEHPDQTPAFTPTVRTPQCEHTVWGTKRKPRLTLRNQETRKLRHPETRTSGNQETRKPNNQDMT